QESLVFVLDVSPSMHPYLHHVSKATAAVLERKLFNHKNDEVGLVLFGMEETDNDLRREVGEAYEGIVSEPITLVDGELVTKLRALPRGCYAGDYVDAIVVATDMIFKKYGDGKKGNKRICLITDAQSPIKEPMEGMSMMEQVEKIAEKMEDHGVRFDAAILRMNEEKRESGSESTEILENLASRTHGEVTTVESPLCLFGALKPRTVTPTTLYRGDMEMTPGARIKVWVYKKAAQERVPSLKVYSDKAPQSDALATHVVKMDTDYKSSDDPTVSIPKAQRAKGYYYGQQLIPVTPDMELSLKFTADKGVKLLGFTEAANIPRHYYMKEPNLFVPEPGNRKASLAMSALARALKQTNMVALVRCVWRQGQRNVVMGVLTPNLSFEDGIADSFYFNIVPFAEDIREFGFASFDDRPASQLPSKQQEEATDLLVQMLDLSPSDSVESLQPEKTSNPVLQRFYHFLYLKSLNPDASVPQLDETLKKVIEPDFSSEHIEKLQGLCSQFTLKTKNSTKFWKDRIEAAAKDDDAEAKPDVDTSGSGLSFDSFATRQVEEVGSLNPVQDFQTLLARRDSDEWVGKAIQGMKKIIIDLLDSSYKGNTYDKALTCLAALRSGCVMQEESKEFNDFFRVLADKCQGKRLSDFWDAVIQRKLTLISKGEVSDSDVTEEAALAFLTSRTVKEEPTTAEEAEEIDEMDALLGEAV
ncbi:hypothetical protein SELMODRAFT_74928, partial [Selaginella moellendorffii]